MITELDLEIRYHPGQVNFSADALSRSLLEKEGGQWEIAHEVMQLTTQSAEQPDIPFQMETDEFVRLQTNDEHLHQIRRYVLEGVLPAEEKLAKGLVLEREHFVVLDNVLYYVDQKPQHQLRVAVPKMDAAELDGRNHLGPFGGHFAGKGFVVS